MVQEPSDKSLGWDRGMGGGRSLGRGQEPGPGDISMGKVRRLGRTGASEEQGYGHMTGYRSREGNKDRVWEWGTRA